MNGKNMQATHHPKHAVQNQDGITGHSNSVWRQNPGDMRKYRADEGGPLRRLSGARVFFQNLILGGAVFVLSFLASGHHAQADPLATAKSVAMHAYPGWSYGADPSKKQIDCVQFVAAVVSKELGRNLSLEERAAILITPPPVDLAGAITSGTAVTKGVQHAVVDIIKKGSAIAPNDAQAGDLVQYWMKTGDGDWFGHAAVISRVFQNAAGNPCATLYGAHKSLNGIADQDFSGAGLNLLGPNRYIYIVRLKP